MTVQFGVAVRNARLDALEVTAGVSALLRLYSGAQPATCATAASGTLVAELPLPSDWMAAAGSGIKVKSGTWEDTSANNAGTVAHFRLYDSTGTTCHMQGSVTITGGGGDLTLDNPVISAGQDVLITSWSLTEGNA